MPLALCSFPAHTTPSSPTRRSQLASAATAPRVWATCLLGLVLCLTGCGEVPHLITPLPEDPRGGTDRERDAAACYAAGLNHAWSGEFGQALAELRQADHLAPDQPLILAAIGFALDDLAHPEDAVVSTPGNPVPPNSGPLRREELTAEAYEAFYRAAQLNSDDARIYERLAAHWYRLSKRALTTDPPPIPPATQPALTAQERAQWERFRKEAERRSADYSLQALHRLVLDGDSDLARQKSLVYINHLGKYYRQLGMLQDELAVVRIHRRLDPTDLGLQLDEIELLYLTRQVASAESRLAAFQTANGKAFPSTAPANATGNPPLPTGPLQRRVNWALLLGRRVQAALRTDSGWPHNIGDPALSFRSPQLHWLVEPAQGTHELLHLFLQDFDHAPASNPLAPAEHPRDW